MDGQSASAKMVLEVRDGKENPFWTIEALGEQIGSVQYSLRQLCEQHGIKEGDDKPDWLKHVNYHLNAVSEYQSKVFQYCAALMHDVYEASDDPNARAKLYKRLTAMAAEHQEKWERIE